MADVFDKEQRSQIMSQVRSRGNQNTELALIRLFRKHRISGWRRHSTIFGKPDFIFYRDRLAVFVDGCFWHGCNRHRNIPVSNRAFWSAKIERNKKRDRLVGRTLRKQGWTVLRIWQHELSSQNQQALLGRLRRALAFDR